jgi:hypothetical protein
VAQVKTITPEAIREDQMYADLNGKSNPPNGLLVVPGLNTRHGVAPYSQGYTKEIREIVNLWLKSRDVHDARRPIEEKLFSLRTRLAASYKSRVFVAYHLATEQFRSKKERGNPVDFATLVAPKERTLQRFFKNKIAPLEAKIAAAERALAGSVSQRDRQREVYIRNVFFDVLEGVKTFPLQASNGSFRIGIRPTESLFRQPVRHQPERSPKTKLHEGDFSAREEWIAALINEQLESSVRRNASKITASADPSNTMGWRIRKAAWFNFVNMVTQDWSARVAVCGNAARRPPCGQPYFKLLQWNTTSKVRLCPGCRTKQRDRKTNGRHAQWRSDAEKEVFRFVAITFSDDIKRKDWHKQRESRTHIAQELNKYIQNAGPAVKTRYRGGVSDGWLNYGKIGEKNWQRVEKIAAKIE